MTPETAAVAYTGILAALGAALVVALVLPTLHRSTLPLLGLAVFCGGELVVLGLVTGAAGAPYLLDLAGAAAVVLELLLAASTAAGAGPRLRWLVPAVWGTVVLPVTALGPLLATAGCAGTSCELQDFGGALPLAIAPAAFLLLAVLVPRSARGRMPEPRPRGALVLAGVLWIAFVVWIAAMEGALDAYTPVLIVAGVVGPLVGGAVWLLIDRARRAPRSVVRSVALGVMTGIVATIAGAATVLVPWSIVVAALSVLVAALVAGRTTGSVGRAGWAVLAAAVLGLLAPVISGEAVGILFTAELSVVPVPLLSAAAVGAFAALVSAPVWIAIRAGLVRRERRDRG